MRTVQQWLASLIAVALLGAIGACFVQDQTMKQLLRLIVSVSLITMTVSAISNLDYTGYSAAMQAIREENVWDGTAVEEGNRSMNRMLIEAECSAYILDKGAALHVPVQEAHVTLCWDTGGFWVPEAADISVSDADVDTSELRDAIATDLGIPEHAQKWSMINES